VHQQLAEVVLQRLAMDTLGIGLLLHRLAAPAFDQDFDIALDQRTHLNVRLRQDERRIDGHS
jgi:hypothetical protein